MKGFFASKFFNVLLLVGIVAAIPLTVYFNQQQQDNRQRASISSVSGTATIRLDPNQRYQTFTGWEATDYIGDPNVSATYTYKDALLQKIVNDIGINRIRLEIYAGVENTTDYFTQWLNGQITTDAWEHNYTRSPVNDNSDPNTIDSNHFFFSMIDWTIDNEIAPLRQLSQARGEKFKVNLCFVSFNSPNSNQFYQYNFPDEYAEFMLATFQHMQSKYGFVPDTIEVILEPDNTSFDGTKMGNAMLATQTKLAANGFNPKYIVPSVTNMDNANRYFTDIKNVVGDTWIRNNVQEFSYHRYGGGSDINATNIGNTAASYNIGSSMLEWWTAANDYNILYTDLTLGRNTAWQAGTFLGILDVNISNQVIVPQITQFIRQYTKYIRNGAVRIGASSVNNTFAPVAFINKDGKYVVVVKASAGGNLSIDSLPAGTYGIFYTTQSQYDVNLTDQTTASGSVLSTSIPAAGVITIYEKAGGANLTPTVASTATPTLVPVTITPTTSPDNLGEDIDRDGCVGILDFNAWFQAVKGAPRTGTFPDINQDGLVDIIDFNLWFIAMKNLPPDKLC